MTSLDDNYAPRCRDERCEVKSSCPLYLDRDNPNARVTAHTLRQRCDSSLTCIPVLLLMKPWRPSNEAVLRNLPLLR